MNKRKTLFILAVVFTIFFHLASVASASPSVQVDAKWERYTVTDEEFSVLLPELPAMATSIQFVKESKRRIRVLGAYRNDVVYAIYTFDNSIKQKWSDFLADNYSLDRDGIQLESHRDINLNGFSGKELVVIGKSSRVVSQFWQTTKDFYIFQTISAKEVVSSNDEFFSSLTLGRTQSGRIVTDGVGAEIDDDLPITEKTGTLNSVSKPADQSLAFTGKDVTRKVILGTKPEPSYTEAARQNQITGTVVLKAVFSSKGRVVNIRVLSGLPLGLTERAINAARQIRFIPAQKDGKRASNWIQLEYNFNLY